MDYKEFYETRARYEREMNDELLRVQELMDDKGYTCCAYVDYTFAHQFVQVETSDGCRIYHHYWAIPNRDEFKDVLKWFFTDTKFTSVTGFMAYDGERNVAQGKYRSIPTFYSEEDVERNYDHYFGW